MKKYIATEPQDNFKIDLVYLWVDDTDYFWKNKINKYRNDIKYFNKEAMNICRFYNNDELKYSLRSVEKNMPWINKIFIVTDEQCPDWLNTDHPKIKIIDHKEIIPRDKLPLFNSNAIESRIAFIEELSEFFLYANDDTFVWEPVKKSFFFDEKGNSICRFDKKVNNNKPKKTKHLYGASLQNSYKIIAEKYNIPIFACYPHHNIDSYRKSLFLECNEEFSVFFNANLDHRFRSLKDIQRIAISYFMLAKGYAKPKFVKLNWIQKFILREQTDSRCFHVKKSNIKKLKQVRCKLLCINDSHNTTDKDRIKIKEFLETKFQTKSCYEK